MFNLTIHTTKLIKIPVMSKITQKRTAKEFRNPSPN